MMRRFENAVRTGCLSLGVVMTMMLLLTGCTTQGPGGSVLPDIDEIDNGGAPGPGPGPAPGPGPEGPALPPVAGVNLPPVASDAAILTPKNHAQCIELTAADPESAVLTFLIVSNPSHGRIEGVPPHLTYTPEAGFLGADAFTFKASDGLVDSAVGTIDITVFGPRAADGGPIEQGETVAGAIDVVSDLDAFTFSGAAGQNVRIRFTGTGSSEWTPVIYLFPPGGGDYVTYTSTYGSTSSTAEIDYQLQATGVYTIVAEDDLGTGVGAYTLALEQF